MSPENFTESRNIDSDVSSDVLAPSLPLAATKFQCVSCHYQMVVPETVSSGI